MRADADNIQMLERCLRIHWANENDPMKVQHVKKLCDCNCTRTGTKPHECPQERICYFIKSIFKALDSSAFPTWRMTWNTDYLQAHYHTKLHFCPFEDMILPICSQVMLKVCLGPILLSAVDNAERTPDSDSEKAQLQQVSNGPIFISQMKTFSLFKFPEMQCAALKKREKSCVQNTNGKERLFWHGQNNQRRHSVLPPD